MYALLAPSPELVPVCENQPMDPCVAASPDFLLTILMGPKGDSHSHIYQDAPAELLAVRYGQVVAIAMILVPTSFLQVQESLRCSLGFCVICFYAVLLGN